VNARPLLALLVLIWAVSWPVIKVGVSAVPPIWFACLRYAIATGVLVAIAGARGTLRVPRRSDRQLVLVSGVLQMAAYSALTALALTRLPAGRASVLAFSTPLWVVPLAVWRGQERVSWRASLGVVVGLVGIVVIALPALLGGGARLAPAYAMLVASAAAWAVSIVFVREHRFEASPIVLAPWQTLVAAIILLLIAVATEGAPPPIGWRGVLALAYVGPVATAFAYWAIVDVGRRLPASTLSVALLATPSLGLLISALTLGERVDVSLIVGMVFVGAGIRLTAPS
jgi:drug/metabolite transporter (DMT)-like permease